MKKELLKLLSTPSQTRYQEQSKNALDVVREMFEGYLVNIEEYEKGGYHSLSISTNSDPKNSKVLMLGHVDVVDPVGPQQFKPYDEGSRVYARGSSDMKGTVVAMVEAFKESLNENPDANITLLVTTDEEFGGFNGASYLVDELGFKGDVAFVPDGGDNWNMNVEEKGVYHLKFVASGLAAHGSRPWRGDNALHKVIRAFNEMELEFFTKYGVPSEENDWIPTINLGSMKGGDAANKVPSSASFKVDIRFNAAQTKEELDGIIKPIAEKYKLETESMVYADPSFTDVNHPKIKKWKELLEGEGYSVEIQKSHGSSDGRFLSAKGVPVVMSKPTCSQAHADDEWIDYDELVKFKDLLVKWLKEVA